MAIHKHREQRPFHLLRHGPLHLWRHLREISHSHHRAVAVSDPEVRRHTIVVWVYVVIGAFVLLLVVLSLLSYGPLKDARDDLNAAKATISADIGNKKLLTTPNGRAQLAQDLGSISVDAAKANASLSNSVSLHLLGWLPVLGTQRTGLIQLSTDVEKATSTGSAMLTSLDHLVSTSHGTTVNLSALAGLEFFVVEGHKNMAKLDRPTGGLLGPIAGARASFDHEDRKILRLLSLSARTIEFARPFLGASGPQTYLVGGMNNAEIRDDGAVLSLDLLTAVNGTFSVENDTTYGAHVLTSPAPVALPAGTEQVFGSYAPTENWPNVDATADFALTGESMQAMWAQSTGTKVDGVIGIDVPGVASILDLTGGVSVPGIPQPVTAANVAHILLDQEYQGDTVNDPQNARRDKIAAVVKAAIDKMKLEHVDLDAFASALSKDVAGRHLLVWSDVRSDESGLKTLDAAGTLTASDPDRTFHIAVENSTADKLDYFLGVKVAMKVTVDPSGTALVNTTITARNGALAGQPPSYQYGPDGVNAFTPGQYVARIFFWGPKGAQIPGSISESGLELTQSHFSLLPQEHNQVTFATVIPHAVVGGKLRLRLVPQARLVPDHLTLTVKAQGWQVSGPTHISTSWGTTLTPSWGLSH